MNYFIGVDLGTTATKTVLFQQDGKIVASSSQAYPLYRDATGMAEEELEDVYQAVISTIREVAPHVPDKKELLAVAFSSQMHSLIAFDESWQPLTRIITWADTRAVAYTEELKASGLGEKIYQKTGTPIHPMAPLSKLLWLRNEQQTIFAQAAHYLDIKGYIFHRLFGSNKIDLSIATGTGIFNSFSRTWDEEALAVTQVHEKQLPQVVSPYEIEPKLSPALAQEMGISETTAFVYGSADGPLSNLGVNAIKKGVAAVTIGTSGAIRVVTDKPQIDPKARTFTYALDETHWVVGGPVNSGGDVLRWLRENIFDNELTLDEITALAKEIPAGAEGLIFHPYLGGERAPLWDANARGSFFGLNYGHTRAHLARAVLEGVMFNIYMVALSLSEVVGDIQLIQASGGFTQSPLWVQIMSNIFEQPISVPESREAGCLAASIMAQKALGLIDKLEIVEEIVGSSDTYEPQAEQYESYRALMAIFIRLSRSMQKEYKNIADYQRKEKGKEKEDIVHD